MRLRLAAILLMMIAIATPGRAEVIHFKNGDKLTGTFERMLGGSVLFKTEVLGNVTIPAKKIETFTTEASVVVMLKSGHTERGHLTLAKTGTWMLEARGVNASLKKKDIVAAYPEAVYRPASPEQRHMPWEDWKASGNFGYAIQHSSGRSGSLTIGLDAVRVEPKLPGYAPHLRSHYTLNMSFVNVTSPSGVTSSANTLTTGFRQDFFFSRNRHNFLFVQAQFDHIEPQNLRLRQTYGGGIGRDLAQYPRLSLSVRTGVNYVKEHFFPAAANQTGGILLRNNAEGLVGEKFTLNIFKRLSFNQQLSLYPSFTSGGDYRFDTINSISSPISPRLSFQIGFTDHYLSNPLPGTEKNDLLLSTGIGFNF